MNSDPMAPHLSPVHASVLARFWRCGQPVGRRVFVFPRDGGELGRPHQVHGQQEHRRHLEKGSEAFHAPQRQVALSALDTTDVGPVEADLMGERLLAQASSCADGSDVAPHDALQLALDTVDIEAPLLDGPRTYE